MTEDMTCREFAKLLKTRDAHYPPIRPLRERDPRFSRQKRQ